MVQKINKLTGIHHFYHRY